MFINSSTFLIFISQITPLWAAEGRDALSYKNTIYNVQNQRKKMYVGSIP